MSELLGQSGHTLPTFKQPVCAIRRHTVETPTSEKAYQRPTQRGSLFMVRGRMRTRLAAAASRRSGGPTRLTCDEADRIVTWSITWKCSATTARWRAKASQSAPKPTDAFDMNQKIAVAERHGSLLSEIHRRVASHRSWPRCIRPSSISRRCFASFPLPTSSVTTRQPSARACRYQV
jgi:hypothetical protein